MKKYIKWLKEEVGELNLVDTVFEADGVSYIDTAVSVMQVYDLIDQLDEPEVLSQEWIRNNQERKGVHFFVNVTKLQNLIVPKQELPVVPAWFHEWWKDIPKGGGNLFHNIGRFQDELFSFETREAYDYITDPDNKKKLLDIIVNELEYEVEEEQKYYVIDKEDNILLIRGYGGIEKADNLKITNSGGGALKLTEQEIKDFDPRYWAFAKPVE